MINRKKILYFVTEDWYFCSHRLPLAIAAKSRGYDVVVLTNVNKHGEIIRSYGLDLIPINISRQSSNPFKEIALIFNLFKIYREIKPDIVHHVAIKPVLYGGIVSYFTKIPLVINALAGLGFIFTSNNWIARFLKPLIQNAFRFILNRHSSFVILQNPDDMNLLINSNVLRKDKALLIRGSGVNVDDFYHMPIKNQVPLIVLASRMLWDKGIMEFVEAARIIKNQGNLARFALVGEGDTANPSSISIEQLLTWQREGVVEWWGRHDDMPLVFSESHIVCLPSYREGLPKVLIEAASCGRPIVTTDVPGCREVVEDGINGLLVPPKNSQALANALILLLDNPDVCIEMGNKGRELVVSKFAVEHVVNKTLDLYEESFHL